LLTYPWENINGVLVGSQNGRMNRPPSAWLSVALHDSFAQVAGEISRACQWFVVIACRAPAGRNGPNFFKFAKAACLRLAVSALSAFDIFHCIPTDCTPLSQSTRPIAFDSIYSPSHNRSFKPPWTFIIVCHRHLTLLIHSCVFRCDPFLLSHRSSTCLPA
jgi:hypothetical protein